MINWIYEHPFWFSFIMLYLCGLCLLIRAVIAAPVIDDEGNFISKKDYEKLEEQNRKYH